MTLKPRQRVEVKVSNGGRVSDGWKEGSVVVDHENGFITVSLPTIRRNAPDHYFKRVKRENVREVS